MTGAGSTTRTAGGCHNKRHQRIIIITPRNHTMANVATRAALLRAKQSKNPNMTDPGKFYTPSCTKGANNAAPTGEGATVTPLVTKNNKATSGQSEEEGSTNSKAQPAAMDVDTHTLTDEGTTVTPPATKGNEDTNAEIVNKGSTNGEAQPAAMDVDAQSGSKRTRSAEKEDR